MAHNKLLIFLQLIIISLIYKTNGFTMRMIPINSPQLQILPTNVSIDECHRYLSNISISRAISLANQFSPTGLKSSVFRARDGFYITQLAFGEGLGKYSPFVLLDTASDETFVQCEGCKPCIPLRGKNFSYVDSSTYERMGIDDSLCKPKIERDGFCGFDSDYMAGPVKGIVGRDNFYFQNAKTGQLDTFKGLAFGCALESDIKFGGNNIIAGIHGLAPGKRSFLNQLDSQIKGRFLYCLVPWWESRDPLGESTIYFGDEAQLIGDATRKIQRISMHSAKRYHLYLNGISVDGNRLPIDPSVFELDEKEYKKGFFIDSGAPYTALAKSAYDPLRDSIVNYFSHKYGWQPMASGQGQPFDVCYDASYPNGVDQTFPSVVFHFKLLAHTGDTDMVLNKYNMFQNFSNNQGFCMPVVRIDDPGPCLFGAFQHTNFKILYDAFNWLLHFVPETCRVT